MPSIWSLVRALQNFSHGTIESKIIRIRFIFKIYQYSDSELDAVSFHAYSKYQLRVIGKNYDNCIRLQLWLLLLKKYKNAELIGKILMWDVILWWCLLYTVWFYWNIIHLKNFFLLNIFLLQEFILSEDYNKMTPVKNYQGRNESSVFIYLDLEMFLDGFHCHKRGFSL